MARWRPRAPVARATGPDSSGFGDGGYHLERLGATAAGQRCNPQRFATSTGIEFMAGTWFGGPSRAGQGVLVDAWDDGTLVVGSSPIGRRGP